MAAPLITTATTTTTTTARLDVLIAERAKLFRERWRVFYREADREHAFMDGDDEAEHELTVDRHLADESYGVCWIFAFAALKCFTGSSLPPARAVSGNDRKRDTLGVIKALRHELSLRRVVMFEYSDPEMHAMVLVANGDTEVLVIDNSADSEDSQMRAINVDKFLKTLKKVLLGKSPDFAYKEFPKMMVKVTTDSDPNPLFWFDSYHIVDTDTDTATAIPAPAKKARGSKLE